MNGHIDLARSLHRLGLVTADDGITHDEEGNVTIHAPSAEATAAVIINPSYSDRIGKVCTRCKAPFESSGIEIAYPPPLQDADPIRVCEGCIESFWSRGKPFRLDWN
jgi:hypothetical protein